MKRLVVSNLGQGSALGKKGENNRRGRKKKSAGEASREVVSRGERATLSPSPGHRSARFAFLFGSAFCLFPPSVEPGPRLVVSESHVFRIILHAFKLALTVSL